ncbi:MAG: nucleoside monophosphate kinase [Holosporales bacterium]|jgi:adenylate kinase|nr:nucleoside monophosphate kinase [Holosporales bacterium]
MWVVFLGAPGSGKGTQVEILTLKFGFVAVSTGDLIRANKEKVIDDGRTIEEIINTGALLPGHVTIELIEEEIERLDGRNVIFDGFPRTLEQADALSKMADSSYEEVEKVINFVMDDDVILKRITGRFRCSECGKIYNEFFNNTRIEGVCDVCRGTEFETRDDDNEESLRKRLCEYHEKTHPLIDFYDKSGILYSVQADEALDSVTKSVLKILKIGE